MMAWKIWRRKSRKWHTFERSTFPINATSSLIRLIFTRIEVSVAFAFILEDVDTQIERRKARCMQTFNADNIQMMQTRNSLSANLFLFIYYGLGAFWEHCFLNTILSSVFDTRGKPEWGENSVALFGFGIYFESLFAFAENYVRATQRRMIYHFFNWEFMKATHFSAAQWHIVT